MARIEVAGIDQNRHGPEHAGFLSFRSPLKQCRAIMTKRSGFTLLEVIVALTVLSTGIIMVFRAFTSTLSAVRLSQNMTVANLLMKDTVWNVEQRGKLGIEIPKSFQDEVTVNSSKFIVRYEIVDTDEPSLKQISYTIAWQERRSVPYEMIVDSYLMSAQ